MGRNNDLPRYISKRGITSEEALDAIEGGALASRNGAKARDISGHFVTYNSGILPLEGVTDVVFLGASIDNVYSHSAKMTGYADANGELTLQMKSDSASNYCYLSAVEVNPL